MQVLRGTVEKIYKNFKGEFGKGGGNESFQSAERFLPAVVRTKPGSGSK